MVDHQRDDRRLHVAVDVDPLIGPLAGPGVATIHLLEGLATRGDLEVTAFAKGLDAHDLDARLPRGVEQRQGRLPARSLEWAWTRLGRPRVDRSIGRPAVVHSLGDLVAPVGRAAHLITIHDGLAFLAPSLADPRARTGVSSIERAVRRGAHLHCTTSATAAALVDRLQVDEGRVTVIPWGIPTLATKEQVEVDHLLPNGADRYVFALAVGTARKGPSTLADAFDQLADDDPTLALVVVGDADHAAFVGRRHADRVALLGRRSSAVTSTLLRGAAVLAAPSLAEGFGFPPLQAMAARVPVVVGDLATSREVLGDAALYATPGDAAALAHGLDAVLSNEALRRDLQIRGRARAARYDWGTTVDQVAALYADLAARHRRLA